MNNRQQLNCMISKVFDFENRYKPYVYSAVSQPMNALIYETMDNMYSPPADGYREITVGEHWGKQWSYAWFKMIFTVPEELAGKELFFTQDTGAVECLVYINGKCCGEFDNSREDSPDIRLHRTKLLTSCAKTGETFEIALEGYNGHLRSGNQPYEEPETDESRFNREYRGITVLTRNRELYDFLLELRIVDQLWRILPEESFQKGKITAAYEKIFTLLAQRPGTEVPLDEALENIGAAREVLKPLLEMKSGDDSGYAGLIGHSHLDTAWIWPMAETVRKAARTFSNALAMMDLYPEYTFIASSPFHYEWMKKYYPDVFDGIKKRVEEGRWEPNGGSWVETDCNIIGGEMLVRQFIKGQRFNRENFGYTADTFWLPDTFGYSASIPQLMKGCGMKYFITTKLSWNETNVFPFDTFMWRGVDGTEVLTHFPMIHLWPDPEGIRTNVYKFSRHKKITDKKLLAYGFGDGGGGPCKEMIDVSRKVSDLCGIPKSKHTTVSAFMNNLAATAEDVPVYDGELYVEGHRGTLTSMHEIKRLNRRIEFGLRNLEIASVMNNVSFKAEKPDCITELYDAFYPNQFHDILPGSSIQRVHDEAIAQRTAILRKAEDRTQEQLSYVVSEKNAVTLFNTLSWERRGTVVLDGRFSIRNHQYQHYKDIDGNEKTAVSGVKIRPFGAVTLYEGKTEEYGNMFEITDKRVETPFASVLFNDNGEIESFIDKESGRELRAEGTLPMNTFLAGDDVPAAWDTWNTDADQKLKMTACAELIESKVISAGSVELRIRHRYKIPRNSVLTQDIIFYADTPRVDFETVIDWNDKHRLLKTYFGFDIVSSMYRSEIQYGFLERASFRDNNEFEQTKFEVCNHKWSDISENRFGVSVLNDCKYGVSADGNSFMLTLMKGGVRPDLRGDAGIHHFTYSILPHNCGFSAESTVKPAYELNSVPVTVYGKLKDRHLQLVEISSDHVICEAVKFAENGNGLVFRLYETEKSGTSCLFKPGFEYKKAYITNMLEEKQQEITPDENGAYIIDFRAFEIKTILFER